MMRWIEISTFAIVITVGVLFTIGCGESPTGNNGNDDNPAEEGTVSGRVIDATTTLGIEGATVAVGGQSGVTNGNGDYNVSAYAGVNQTVNASADGYVSLGGVITVLADTTVTRNFELIPETGADIARIVLTWDAEPRDLDSHLWAPTSGGTSYYHIYYANGGTLEAPPWAKLDIDDTDGYGPETVTIAPDYDEWHPDVYTYAVYEYAGDGMLIDSDATVRVYVSDELVDTIHVPNLGTCGENWYWTVGTLAIDEGTWTRVNTMATSPPIAYMREGK